MEIQPRRGSFLGELDGLLAGHGQHVHAIGGSNFEFASLVLNKDNGFVGVKSDKTDN